MGYFSDMPDGSIESLRQYQAKQAAADDRADEAEEYRDVAIAELADEILTGHKDALCSLSEALAEGVPADEVGDAMHCLAVLTMRVLHGQRQPRTREEDQALVMVRGYVETYLDTWSGPQVDDRMYKLAGLE